MHGKFSYLNGLKESRLYKALVLKLWGGLPLSENGHLDVMLNFRKGQEFESGGAFALS